MPAGHSKKANVLGLLYIYSICTNVVHTCLFNSSTYLLCVSVHQVLRIYRKNAIKFNFYTEI